MLPPSPTQARPPPAEPEPEQAAAETAGSAAAEPEPEELPAAAELAVDPLLVSELLLKLVDENAKLMLRLNGYAERGLRDGGGAASVASFLAAVLAEIHLCNVCSCQEILRRNGRGQAAAASLRRSGGGNRAAVVSEACRCWRVALAVYSSNGPA
eukprot:COSAG01_NODE_3158_length_6489_cov_2.264945_2_plen_155_part_00